MNQEERIRTEGTRSYRLCPIEGEKNYRFHMLVENRIPGILKTEERETEEGSALAFDISSLTTLEEYCRGRTIKARELGILVQTLEEALMSGEAYLLEPACFVFQPEEIYLEPERFTVGFLCLTSPTGDWRGSLQELFRFLLEKIDYREEKAVHMAYELYHISLQANFPVQRLKECAMQILKGEEGADDEPEEELLSSPGESVPEHEPARGKAFPSGRENRFFGDREPKKKEGERAFPGSFLFRGRGEKQEKGAGGDEGLEKWKAFLSRDLPAFFGLALPVIAGAAIWLVMISQ